MFLRIRSGRGQRISHRHHRIAVVGDKKRVSGAERLRDRARRRRAVGAVFFKRDNAPAAAAHRLLEGRLHHIAVGILGQ